MLKEILISSRNDDKIREITDILSGLPVKLFTAYDFPGLPEVEEDRDTLLGNALKKAEIIARITGMAALSDDTGLFIDALNGEPGVRSARFAGEECLYRDNRLKVLQLMNLKEDRNARFVTVSVLALPDGRYVSAEGVLTGRITVTEMGDKGFGYDAIFLVPELSKTLAELTTQQKNAISHRGKAFLSMAAIIKKLTEEDLEKFPATSL